MVEHESDCPVAERNDWSIDFGQALAAIIVVTRRDWMSPAPAAGRNASVPDAARAGACAS